LISFHKQKLDAVLWIASISIILSIIFGFLPLQQVDTQHHVGHAFYIALTRSAWNYALVWPIFSCVNGRGGIVKWFLELPVFQPLGRMGLSFFLVSSVYLQFIPQMQPEFFGNRNMVSLVCGLIHSISRSNFQIHQFCGDFVMTFLLAMVLYLAVEAPVLAIERSVCRKESREVVESSARLTQDPSEVCNHTEVDEDRAK
jgi:hypothetical protein